MAWLVTGGLGFAGSSLVASLLDDGQRVVVVDALFRRGWAQNRDWLRRRAPADRLEIHVVDIARWEEIERILACVGGELEAIAHLAGQVAMTDSLRDPRRDFESNAQGTLALLEAVRRHAPQAALLYASTNKVYGDLAHVPTTEEALRFVLPDYPAGLDESLPLDFSSPYGCSKGAADQYTRDYARAYDLKTVVFRHSTIYGARQHATYDQGWVGWFCAQLALQTRGELAEPFTISGTGKQVRDLLDVRDLVRLYKLGAEAIDEVAGEVFNIGGGPRNSLSILELVRTVSAWSGCEAKYRHIERRLADQDVFIADARKARERLGWEPRVSWEDGVRATAEAALRGLEANTSPADAATVRDHPRARET